MSDETARHPITNLAVIHRVPGMDAVTVRRDIEFGAAGTGPLTLDVYEPPGDLTGQRRPAVVFVTGFSDVGFATRLGCKQKDMAFYRSWARLIAASGIVAITYENRDPAADVRQLFQFLRQNATALDLDMSSLAVWSCSGNVPTALWVLIGEPLACAVLCYGFMLDLDGRNAIADAQTQWRFANPAAGKTARDIPSTLPILIVRAGRDETPTLNEMIDLFSAHALAANLTVSIANHPSLAHAFDLHDDSEESRDAIRGILSFLRLHLLREDAVTV
jgi:hypothetical protein